MLKGYLFGPVKQQGVIKTVDINFMDTANYDSIDEAIAADVERISNINIIPGLTANGEPTSNASLSIDKTLINANDNYGYITTRI